MLKYLIVSYGYHNSGARKVINLAGESGTRLAQRAFAEATAQTG